MLGQSAAWFCLPRLCHRKHGTLADAGLLPDWPAQLHAALTQRIRAVRRRLVGAAVFVMIRRAVFIRDLPPLSQTSTCSVLLRKTMDNTVGVS